jgi:hypothetical protein
MCWAFNHQNTLEMAQGHISLSTPLARPLESYPRHDSQKDLDGGDAICSRGIPTIPRPPPPAAISSALRNPPARRNTCPPSRHRHLPPPQRSDHGVGRGRAYRPRRGLGGSSHLGADPRNAPTMAWGEDEPIGPDVASVGLHVSERIGRDAAA